jgi:nitronate monooxygenase
VRVLLDAKVPAFSFLYGTVEGDSRRGSPPRHRHDRDPDDTGEAIALEEAGVDVVVASGFEAGGHRGSFLRSSEDSLTGTICPVPQIVDAVGVPVVAAGGNSGTRGSAAAFALGAHGAQMGTVFLACEKSGATTFEPTLH